MIRIRTGLFAAAVAAMALIVAPGAASAQDYPGTTATTAPAGCTLSVGFSAPALPNATLNVTIGCSSIVAGRTYTGTLLSTPVTLPSTVAATNGTITFQGVRLPADWAVNATHTASLVDQATGRALGSVSFYVDRTGRITAPPTQGNIPRTGSDYVEPALQIGAALLAAGTAAVVVSRRRRAGTAAA